MTGYPGDEHVFSVVVIVLARSPDCNLLGLAIFCAPATLLHCVVSDLSVLHLLCILWTVRVSAVYLFQVCRVLCAFRQLILKQQLISYAAAVKSTALSQVVSEPRVDGTKREYASSRDWSWDNACGRAIFGEERTRGVAVLGGRKLEFKTCWRKILSRKSKPFHSRDSFW